MKQHYLLKQLTPYLLLLTLAFFPANCGWQDKKSDKEIAGQLIDFLNSRMPGSKFKANLDNCVVTPAAKKRFKIIFRDVSFTSDLTLLVHLMQKNLFQRDTPEEGKDTVRMEETEIIYGPEDNYLNLSYIKGLSLERDISGAKEKKQALRLLGFSMNKVRIHVGKITYRNLDMDELIKTGQTDFTEVTTGLGDARPFESDFEHFKIESIGSTAKNENISVLLDIEKVGKADGMKEDPEALRFMLDQNAPPPDFRSILQKGLAVMDLNIELGKISISIKKDNTNLCTGVINNAFYSQFMKPDDSGIRFKMGNKLNFKNIELSLPGKRELQLLSRVKELGIGYQTKGLTPEAALALIDFLKKGFPGRNMVDSEKMREHTSLVMKFMFEVMKSKPQMQFSISPIKHYFGEMEIVADLRLYNLMAGPVLTITINVHQVDDVLNKLKEANVLSTAALRTISQIIDQLAVKKDNGDASYVYEMDIHQFRKMIFKSPLIPPTSGKPAVLPLH